MCIFILVYSMSLYMLQFLLDVYVQIIRHVGFFFCPYRHYTARVFVLAMEQMGLCWYRMYVFVTFTDTIFMSVCLRACAYFTAVHFVPVHVYIEYIQMGLECIAEVNQT